MWIIILTILFLLMQNCSTTKLIDLPDSEEYEDGVKSFIEDIESSTSGYPLRKSLKASRDAKEIEISSPGHLGQSIEEKAVDSLEIDRSSPNAKNTDNPKGKESRNNKLPLSQSYAVKTRRVSVIEPQITISRERNSRISAEKRRHSRRHHSVSRSSRESSGDSKEIDPRSFHYRKYGGSSIERTSLDDGSNNIRRSNDPDKYDNEKDENIKKKLTSLVEQTLHDTEKKIESVQGIKNSNRDLAPYKIGFILSMVKKSRDMMNELFNTAVKHRDSWRALEQLKIFELIAHTNVDTTNLVRQLVEIHIQHINSTMSHGYPANTHPPPEGDRKRVVLL